MKTSQLLFLLLSLFSCRFALQAEILLFDADAARSNLPFALTAQADGGALAPLQVQTATEPRTPYFADFAFALKTPGEYAVWAFVLGCDAPWVSVFTWQIDRGEACRATPQAGSGEGVPRWVKLGVVTLSPGDHHLRFEVTQRRQTPDDAYAFALWQAALVPAESDFVPSPASVNLGYNPQINRSGNTQAAANASAAPATLTRISNRRAAPVTLRLAEGDFPASEPIWRDYAEGAVVPSDDFFIAELIAPLRPRFIRKDHGLSRVTGTPGEMDYSSLLRLVRAVRKVGAEPIIGLDQLPAGCLPRNAQGEIKPRSEWLADPEFLPGWERTVADALTALDAAGLSGRYFQCFNEPEFSGYAEYPELAVAIYDTASRVVKAHNPNAKMFGIGCGDGVSPVWSAFLDYLTRHPENTDYFDYHLYQATPEFSIRRHEELRQELAKRNLSAIQPAITEWGLSSSGLLSLRNGMANAIYNAQMLKGMVDADVQIANLFCLRDFEPDSGKFGLIGSDGALKPAYWGQWLWAQLPDSGTRLAVTGGDSVIDGIAFELPQEAGIALLLWYGADDAEPIREITVELPEKQWPGVQVRERILDNVHHIGYLPPGSPMEIPAIERAEMRQTNAPLRHSFRMIPNSMRLIEFFPIEQKPDLPVNLRNNPDLYGHMAM